MKGISPTRDLTLITWKDARNDVLKVNKELCEIIDAIDPGNKYKFVKAKYLYGDQFIKNGVVHLPYQDDLAPISHPLVDKNIQKELFYSSMPLFLTLDKDNEVFIDSGKRIIPLNLFHKGSFGGVYEAMDFNIGRISKPIWNYTAGSRSIFMLPKITDRMCLKKLLMTYNVANSYQIKELTDHWELFKTIAQNKNFTQVWQNSILFFGEKWLTNKHKSSDWDRFKNYLLSIIWEQAVYAIDKLKFNLCWEKFAELISLRRLQPKPYLIDQVKHLLSIITGDFPAFTPMNNSQDAAPIEGLQKAFVEHYGLKQNLPILLHACMLHDNIIKPNYVYYSLSLPTILEGSPLKKTSSTIISDMREIKLLMETLKNPLKKKPDLEDNEIIQNAEIDYFHYEKDICNQIRSSDIISKEDPSFMQNLKSFPSHIFSHTSPFFSGCVRMSIKNTLANK